MLSFKEKRDIQKQIKSQYEALAEAGGFSKKRSIQKSIKELYAKLNSKDIPDKSNKKFDEMVQKKLDDGIDRVVSFDTKEEAERFATAYSRATKKGHSISGNSVKVYDLTKDEHAWIDQYIENNRRLTAEEINEIDDMLSELSGVSEQLETIKAVLENQNATYDDYKQLEEAISIVEENEDQLSDNILYNEVINLLEDLVDGGTVADSITGIGLFDEVTMDRAKNKVREFMTYRAWKRAVKELDKHAEFTGDEDIDGAHKRDHYEAEWDGDVGHIIMMD